jgi:hypothetical protein
MGLRIPRIILDAEDWETLKSRSDKSKSPQYAPPEDGTLRFKGIEIVEDRKDA